MEIVQLCDRRRFDLVWEAFAYGYVCVTKVLDFWWGYG